MFSDPRRIGPCAIAIVLALVTGGSPSPAQEEAPDFTWTEGAVGEAFDEFWGAMDRQYSYFAVKPGVDWPALRERFRPKAVAARSAEELADVLEAMLANLEDGHVWITGPGGMFVGTHRHDWQYNGNNRAVRDGLKDPVECGKFAVVGRTEPDGFGYFLMTRQSKADAASVARAIEAIDALRDCPGFVVDLRIANGGDERLARKIASRFCAEDVVYARSKFRDGPGHDDFTQDFERVLPASAPGVAYRGPVVCLIGPGAVSSGEGFVKMMSALPNVTTVGLPTRGSSGNPGPIPVGGTGLVVYASRWVDMLPDGTPIEGRGIAPEVVVEAPDEAYEDRDPTLEKGLSILREKVAETAKEPENR